MAKLPKRKIEDRALETLTKIINAHPTMDHDIPRGDKNMSWDGYIRIFTDGKTDSDKKNFDADIPVQIKGHIDKTGVNLGKDRIMYPVDIDDLNVYFRGNGCLYFQIFISEDGEDSCIYYNSLYPSKIQFYLRFAMYKRNKKTYSIPFVRLEQNSDELAKLCKQFSCEIIHQGPGRGQIVSRTINANSLKDVKNTHFNAVDVTSPYDFMERISTGDLVTYGSFETGGIDYPIGWGDNYTAALGQNIHDPIYVGEKKYYCELCKKVTLKAFTASEMS